MKYVLPGHGVPGGREVLNGQAQFMTELHKAVKAGVDQGKKLEELQASIEMPGAVANWVGPNSLKGQIRDTYNQITHAQ